MKGRRAGGPSAGGTATVGAAPSTDAPSLPVGSGRCQSSCCGCCRLRLCLPFSSDCFQPGPGWGRNRRRHVELLSASFTLLLHPPRIAAPAWKLPQAGSTPGPPGHPKPPGALPSPKPQGWGDCGCPCPATLLAQGPPSPVCCPWTGAALGPQHLAERAFLGPCRPAKGSSFSCQLTFLREAPPGCASGLPGAAGVS